MRSKRSLDRKLVVREWVHLAKDHIYRLYIAGQEFDTLEYRGDSVNFIGSTHPNFYAYHYSDSLIYDMFILSDRSILNEVITKSNQNGPLIGINPRDGDTGLVFNDILQYSVNRPEDTDIVNFDHSFSYIVGYSPKKQRFTSRFILQRNAYILVAEYSIKNGAKDTLWSEKNQVYDYYNNLEQ